LEHLTAFVIVFAAGVTATASFIGYMERVRRNAVRDHYRRANTERSLSSVQMEQRSIEK
jgi:hypothetical protein